MLDLEEVRVEFPSPTSTLTRSQYTALVAHPLRPNDETSTLHCIYLVVRNWIVVCWCDERGEYMEHEVFADNQGGLSRAKGDKISASAAGRIWAGCLRYRALFGGRLRVVLGQWQGTSVEQAAEWRAYAAAWSKHTDNVDLVLVNIGLNPPEGLSLIHSTTSHPANYAAAATTTATKQQPANHNIPDPTTRVSETNVPQFTLILHSQQPHLHFPRTTSDRPQDFLEDEIICHSQVFPTGYLIMESNSPAPATAAVPCLCVQLLSPSPTHNQASSADMTFDLLTTRSVLKQYHQMAWLRHAELDLRTLRAPSIDSEVAIGGSGGESDGTWPVRYLPLPIAVLEDIQNAIEPLLLLPQNP
ncbi:hypothetical protein LPJ66_011421 [Kickxella alabastrina]|uniref:Uncharacterized protein n=1 Tax=Kickxella alabastrina TaxID=61397 RepID=A0ACC1HYE3_9FUNG|nr:hypothetical protein LPJ66_011421 [Kickxella alabastrina]